MQNRGSVTVFHKPFFRDPGYGSARLDDSPYCLFFLAVYIFIGHGFCSRWSLVLDEALFTELNPSAKKDGLACNGWVPQP